MSMFSVPPTVKQNISRARAYTRRNEPDKAIESLIGALNLFEPNKVIGKAKYEVEILLMENVEELSLNPRVQKFLKKVTKPGNELLIPYAPGHEQVLLNTLPIILKILQEEDEAQREDSANFQANRRKELWEKGTKHILEGDGALGKATLRHLADEFGKEEGVLFMIGEFLGGKKFPFEAAEFLEQSLAAFPKDNRAYTALIKTYSEIREFEKAEAVYIKALKAFGRHTVTLLNFANFYRTWGKKDKAYETAKAAKQIAPDNKLAQEIMDWADRRN